MNETMVKINVLKFQTVFFFFTVKNVAYQECFFRSSLIWVLSVCLDLFGWQLLFEILEHLP